MADEMGLTHDLAKTVVLSLDRENAPKKALISNIKGLSGGAIAEQFLNRWPVFGENEHKIADFDSNEINNTLDLYSIDSALSSFGLLNELILRYLSKTVFKDIDNMSDITSLDRILYTINGKILSKEGYIKAHINSYQPERLNQLFRSASFGLTRLHIIDQNKKNIVILASKL